VDAPSHLFKEGKTIDKIDPGVFWGSVRVYDLEGKDCIDVEDIAVVKPGQRAIIRTGFGGQGGEDFYPYMMPEAARYLVNCGLILLGIDTPSVDPPGTDRCHRILLGSGMVIVENIWLEGIPPGPYQLSCLPLPLLGADGSPARVLLREESV
jgi:arylformamidase